jgi:hypothetical protein
MDPFIESSYFGSLHDNMIFLLQEMLQGRLPNGYFAASAQRVWIDTMRWMEPDVKVLRSTKGKPREPDNGDTRVASLAQPVVVTVPLGECTEPHLKIYKKRDGGKRLVCSIEILSLSNKTPGEKGETLYRRKQTHLLNRKIHLVEIDLLRAGHHTTAVALDWAKAKTGDYDYHVCVRRFNRFEKFDVYPILLQDRLPTIAIPLLPADGDVAIELQAIFDRAYEAGPYRKAIDYRNDEIEPPLTKTQDEWVRSVLRSAGIERKRRLAK